MRFWRRSRREGDSPGGPGSLHIRFVYDRINPWLFEPGAAVAPNPFIDWLDEVGSDPVIIFPDDISAEARGNLWSFSLSEAQSATVRAADVLRFAERVLEARRAWLCARNANSMLCYWWHDDQAGQLRFSLVSTSHGRLPFGCSVAAAPNLQSIVQPWLASTHPHLVPWSELQPTSNEEGEMPRSPLAVWSQILP